MKPHRKTLLRAAFHTLVWTATLGASHAQNSISINFTDSTAVSTITTGTPGAIPVAAANWNNLNSVAGDGTATGLKNDLGATTAASINWISANTWRSGGTSVNGNGQLTKGYLDDGGGGSQISFSGIPYLSYSAYIIVAGDTGGGTVGNQNYRPVSVNGLGYSHNDIATVQANVNWTGNNFNDTATLTEGLNYLKVNNLGGLGLSIRGGNNLNGFRGPIAGVQIQNTYAGAFSYWDINGAAPGAGGAAPAGTWDSGSANWNALADGSGVTAAWAGVGHTAVFAAGTDATGAYSVTVSGTQAVDAIIAEEGNITLNGGNINLSLPAVIRAGTGSSLTINSSISGSNGLVLEGASGISLSGVNPVSGSAVVSVPSLALNSGASLPSLSSLVIGSAVSVTAQSATVTATGDMTVANGSQITSGSSSFTIGGDIVLNGAGYSASGTSLLKARNLTLNLSTAVSSMSLSGSSTVDLVAVAPAQSNFRLNGGSVTLSDSSILKAERWTNAGMNLAHALNISGSAQLSVTDDLVFGDQVGAALTVTQTGGSVTNTGTTNNPTGNDLSNRWGHYGTVAATTYNISAGTLALTGAPLYLSWDSAATLNISGTAAVNLKGVNMGFGNRAQASTINLTGGQLLIGSDGIVSSVATNKVINLGLGTLGASETWASSLAMNVTAAHTVDTGALNISLGGGLTGEGGITKLGAGTLTITGAATYAGPTNVSAGTLQVGGTIGGQVNVATGAAVRGGGLLPGLGTVSSLNLGNGSSSTFRIGAASDRIAISTPDGFTTNGTHSINIAAAAGITPGTYTLFDYNNSIGEGGFGSFAIGTRPHIVAALANNVANSSVDLVVTSIDTLVWTGANGSDWNLNSAQNWALASNSSQVPYFQGDLVLFPDSATTGNVVLSGTITPGDVVFDNSELNYTLSGSGITGSTDLIKLGIARVTLLNENIYTGSTVVSAGALQLGNGTISGSLNVLSPIVVSPSAEFILHPAGNGVFAGRVSNEGIFRVQGTVNTTLGGAWPAPNPGDIIVDSTGITTFSSAKPAWTGDLVGNAGTVRVPANGNTLGQASNARTLTFNGVNTVLSLEINNVFGNGATLPAAVPVIVLNGATLRSNSYNVLGEVVLNGARIDGASIDPSAVYRGFEMRGKISVIGAAPSLIETTTAHENHLDIATQFAVGDVTSSPATDLLVTAPFRNGSPNNATVAGGFVKTGPGTMELTAASTNTGAVSVDAGTLKVTGLGSLAASSVVVKSGATLSGGGGGTIALQSGSILNVEINGASVNGITATGELNITGATVNFSVLGGGANQASYVIAQYGTLVGGTFATVNNLPAGYTLSYAFGPNANQIALVSSSSDPYQNWATSPPYNLSGANALAGADPDNDGISNGIEFVIGGNPANGNDSGKLPVGTLVGGNYQFAFRRTALSNYSPFPFVQYGSNLTSWTAAQDGVSGVAITVTANFHGAGIDRVVVSIPQALADGQKLFARLNVNR